MSTVRERVTRQVLIDRMLPPHNPPGVFDGWAALLCGLGVCFVALAVVLGTSDAFEDAGGGVWFFVWTGAILIGFGGLLALAQSRARRKYELAYAEARGIADQLVAVPGASTEQFSQSRLNALVRYLNHAGAPDKGNRSWFFFFWWSE